MKNPLLISGLFLMITFLFSSCMMMAPVGMTGAGHHSSHENASPVHVDPVCGNSLETTKDELSFQYEGTTYYFHSGSCMDKFREQPGMYVAGNHNHHEQRNGATLIWGLGGLTMVTIMLLMLL